MTKEELRDIQERFKSGTLGGAVGELLKDPTNYDIGESFVSGYAIGIYRKNPCEDFGTFCYYKNKEDRDADLALLKELGIG